MTWCFIQALTCHQDSGIRFLFSSESGDVIVAVSQTSGVIGTSRDYGVSWSVNDFSDVKPIVYYFSGLAVGMDRVQ